TIHLKNACLPSLTSFQVGRELIDLDQIDSILGSSVVSGPELKLKRRLRNLPNHNVAILIEIGGQQLSVKNDDRLHEMEMSRKTQRYLALLFSLPVVFRMR